MARPVKKRTVVSYRRDVEALTRLRSAIKLDPDLTKPLADKTCVDIDTLIDSINELIKHTGTAG